jgi:hypothetical protein
VAAELPEVSHLAQEQQQKLLLLLLLSVKQPIVLWAW